tara:strand:- start:592 stop:1173 length:582 start_codon:yes stop_codon:yes gene_type:complete
MGLFKSFFGPSWKDIVEHCIKIKDPMFLHAMNTSNGIKIMMAMCQVDGDISMNELSSIQQFKEARIKVMNTFPKNIQGQYDAMVKLINRTEKINVDELKGACEIGSQPFFGAEFLGEWIKYECRLINKASRDLLPYINLKNDYEPIYIAILSLIIADKRIDENELLLLSIIEENIGVDSNFAREQREVYLDGL